MTNRFITQEHVAWECTYHIVITPKYRKRVLYGPVRVRIGKMMRELAQRKGIEVVEENACPDHMHIVLQIPPKYSVAHVMGFLKGFRCTWNLGRGGISLKRVSGAEGTV